MVLWMILNKVILKNYQIEVINYGMCFKTQSIKVCITCSSTFDKQISYIIGFELTFVNFMY